MKKTIFLRALFGIPTGITIGYLITIFTSLGWGHGSYFPCVPDLVRVMGSEIKAVIVQTVLCALLGMVFAASSVIWEFESWSIARQTGLYFLVTSAVMMPFAYFLHWMEHSPAGFFSYLGVFAVIFILIWLFQYMIIRHKIKKINSGLK